jgi:hypothetical protein
VRESRASSSTSSTWGVLEERSIVFVDDVQLPGVRRAVAFCLSNLGWTAEGGGEEGFHEWLVPSDRRA